MKKITVICMCALLAAIAATGAWAASKPTPDQVIEILKKGNARFVSGQHDHPNSDAKRLAQAGSESQNDHAIATVITCSDSRVPVERIFDQGIMDLFIIRVAGNVVRTDEAGSIEYGLAHVKTPVLVVLGHTQCGAVTATVAGETGHGHQLERNIPPLIAPIKPAVRKAIKDHPNAAGQTLVEYAVVENVWQGVEDLFMASPATVDLVRQGKAKVVGAIYNVGTGEVFWMPEYKVELILQEVLANPDRATNIMYEGGKAEH